MESGFPLEQLGKFAGKKHGTLPYIKIKRIELEFIAKKNPEYEFIEQK